MDQMHQNPKCAHHDARRGRAGTAVAVYIESGMAPAMSECTARVNSRRGGHCSRRGVHCSRRVPDQSPRPPCVTVKAVIVEFEGVARRAIMWWIGNGRRC